MQIFKKAQVAVLILGKIDFLKILFIFREGKGERKREKNIKVLLPLTCPLLETWPTTQARVLGWESNQLPFGL